MASTSFTLSPRARNAQRLTRFCLALTGITLGALLLAAIVPGSPSGGPDGPYLIVFFTFLGVLYLVLPSHVFCAGVVFWGWVREKIKRPYLWPVSYFVAWFAAAIVYTIASGLADPAFEAIEDWSYERNNPNEVALLKLVRSREPGPDAVRQLVDAGADIEVTDKQFGLTPLLWASMRSSAEAVDALIAAGANVEARAPRTWGLSEADLDQATVLDMAVWSRHEPAAKARALLDAGATPGAQSLVGACWLGDLELYQRMVSAGVDPRNATDAKGQHCMHAAAGEGHAELLTVLLAAGLDPNAPTEYRARPLDRAADGRHAEAAALLVQAGGFAHNDWRLTEWVERADPDELAKLSEMKILSALDEEGARRALAKPLLSCDVPALERLLTAGLAVSADARIAETVPSNCRQTEAILELISSPALESEP